MIDIFFISISILMMIIIYGGIKHNQSKYKHRKGE